MQHTIQTPANASVQHWDAVVVGGGIAGLSAAWQLVRAGLAPLLVEARGYTGGLVAASTLGGVSIDIGAEGFVSRGDAVTSMIAALNLQIVAPQGGGAQLFLPPLPTSHTCASAPAAALTPNPNASWRLHHFPKNSFLGIPAFPNQADVVEILGQAAATRASADATLPGYVGTRANDPADLAAFVAARMGRGVLERLVRPIVSGIHTTDPANLDADTVAPGLRAATARLGSLQAAVRELLEQRTRTQGVKATDVTTYGGLTVLTDALREAITAGGGQVRTRTGACQLHAASGQSGFWDLTIAPTRRGATPAAEPVPTAPTQIIRTRRVIIACSAPAALRLLATVKADARDETLDTCLRVPAGAPIARFMLLAHAPGLDSLPVGSGLLVAPPDAAGTGAPCPVKAKSLSHLNAKWSWLNTQISSRHGAGVHALRLSYGRAGQASPKIDLATALADVAALTGVKIAPADVIDQLQVHWDGTLPPVPHAYRIRAERLVAAVGTYPGLALSGAWVAGTGVAAVVAQSRAQAARLIASS